MSTVEATIRAGRINGLENRITRANNATKNLIHSFYFFLLLLVNSVLIDPIEVIGLSWSLPAVVDVGLSGIGMFFGVWFLFLGGIEIKGLLRVS